MRSTGIRSTRTGMSRRHFLQHASAMSSLLTPAALLVHSFRAHASELRHNQKSAILLWMGGGPSTIDIWDLKPNSANGGPFRPIATSGDGQICEHLPRLAGQMDQLSIVRAMSTREADHRRGTYYMHTGYVPRPNMAHPSYGSVIAHQLQDQRTELEIPPFVSIGGSSIGGGFLGMAWSPFVVSTNGRIRNLEQATTGRRLDQRLKMLGLIERSFIAEGRGQAAVDHASVLEETQSLLSSRQMDAFQYQQESAQVLNRYGDTGFGRSCVMARRLVEVGVPFVEVDFGGWDNHQDVFGTLENKLPEMDQAMSALVEDLTQRGLWESTAVIWMGEFGRTPRINANAGRDHWARSWSAVVGGADFLGGRVIGSTNEDGTEVEGPAYRSQDLMASVCKSLGMDLETTFTSRSGRPMKIANSGIPIDGLFAD